MKTLQNQSEPGQRGASASLHSLSSGAVSPLSTASITLAALLILTIPVCISAPAERQQATTDQRQLFSQIDAVCSSYLSADLRSWASDVLRELCVLLLVQNSKEVKVRENSKRAELEGPGGIQSRGYFLYRIIAFESMARLFRGDKTVSNRFNFRLKQKDFSSDCLTVVT
ncbi:uncharacterized protein V6R79_001124 [Siganus canaliculatus]